MKDIAPQRGCPMTVTCPKCAHKFSATNVMRDSSIAAWTLVEQGVMSNKAFASSRGLSPTTVTLYRRLGICIMELGLDPVAEPELWDQVANKTLAITDPEVRHAIEMRWDLQFLRDMLADRKVG